MRDSERPALWIAHNYASDVGYAWANISALFVRVAAELHARGAALVMSFATNAAQATQPLGAVPTAVEEFDFSRRGISAGMQVRRIIRRHGVRHVYLTDQPPTRWLYGWMRLLGVRTILVHNRISVPDPHPARADAFPRRLMKWLWARMPGLSVDRVYAVSQFVADRLAVKAQVPRSRIVRIYNGIDTSRFVPTELPGPGPVTLFAGCRADRHKGIDVLIDACAELRKRGFDFQARYAGSGSDLEMLKQKAADYGLADRFVFLGELRGVAAEMKSAGVLVVPSNWGDACPSAVLEAMASGKPLVATRAGGIPELVEEGVSGLLVPPGNAAALAEALARVIADPAYSQKLGRAARERAVRHFDVKRYHGDVVGQMLADLRWPAGPAPASVRAE
jgi:glycosyltransferase involved in cell wall biosynthesis